MRKQDRYRDAGVNIDLADSLIEKIKPLARSTMRKGVIGNIGGFGGFFSPKLAGFRNPVLVSGTDGVGTKLKIAHAMNRHNSIGIDLVAMCANDVVTCGAEPLFFLDYFATGKLDARVGRDVIAGIAEGCRQAGCALIGGETAEMPGFYAPGEYDLAGFVVGAVEHGKIIDGSKTKIGDAIIGIESSGLHSNGYSLVRKVFIEEQGRKLSGKIRGLKTSLGNELLKPTRIYVKTVLDLAKRFTLRGIAHITGGGITENLPRILPDRKSAFIRRDSWKPHQIFKVLQKEGQIDDRGMYRTFNMGIGMILIVAKTDAEKVVRRLMSVGESAHILGEVVHEKNEPRVIYDPPLVG